MLTWFIDKKKGLLAKKEKAVFLFLLTVVVFASIRLASRDELVATF